MKKITFLLLLLVLSVNAQNDCKDAIAVCGNSGYDNLEVKGAGISEISSVNSCTGEETNSIWFKLYIKTGGTLGFNLIPTSKSIDEDFDFFIFGPNATCGNLGMAIRCSTTNPEAAGSSSNITGMNETETDTSEGPGPEGNNFIKWLTVKSGETYFLAVDRPIGNGNFKLEWTGTAKFSDPPKINKTATINNTLNIEKCDIDNIDDKKTPFDLTVNDVVVGTQTNVKITYHTSNNDAILGVKPIANPSSFVNTSNPQKIYIRLHSTGTECFTLGDFMINVIPTPIANQPSNYEVCDDKNSGSSTDGKSSFLLKTKDREILNGLDPNTYKLSYHTSLNDAVNNSNHINKNVPYTNTQQEQIIYIRLENKINSKCIDTSKNFKLIVNAIPKVTPSVILKQCDDNNDGFTFFNLKEAEKLISTDADVTFLYYNTKNDAINNTNSIEKITTYKNKSNNESIWVRTISKKGCIAISELTLVVSTTQIPSSFEIVLTQCDENDTNPTDAVSSFNLIAAKTKIRNLFPTSQEITINFYESEKDALSEENKIEDITAFRNTKSPNKQYLYVRVDSKVNNECMGLGRHIKLIVHPLPYFTVVSPQYICVKTPLLTLKTTNPKGIYSYKWTKDNSSNILGTNTSLKITSAGKYTITATDKVSLCSFKNTIVVHPIAPPSIEDKNIITSDDTPNKSIKIVGSLVSSNYEYALSNDKSFFIDYQDNPIFENLSAGYYTVMVKDKRACATSKFEVALLEFQTFFTPNEDGHFDTWNILGTNNDYFKSVKVKIFDRYGKLLKELTDESSGWNGIYNGKPLPSNDYWYTAKLVYKNGKVLNKTGHFALLRK